MRGELDERLGPFLVRNWLREKHLKSQWLSAQIEVNPSTLSRWLSGRLLPSKVSRMALASILKREELVDRWDEVVP